MAGKKKNPVKESQPANEKLNVGVDLNEIGERKAILSTDTPKVRKKAVGDDNKVSTEFMNPREDLGSTIKQMDILQPFLTEEEVKKIGIAKWHTFRGNPDIYTTVINGRRFKLRKPLFMDLKDKGLVIQVG